jgi:predicted dienelactone hydrolase
MTWLVRPIPKILRGLASLPKKMNNVMGRAYSVSRQTRVRWVVPLFALATFSIFLIFAPYKSLAVTGPYAVATASYTYIDDERIEQFSNSGENRRVNVAFWYPQTVGNDEKYPLVVFSHGGLGLQSSNESLYRELASHGYFEHLLRQRMVPSDRMAAMRQEL